MKCDENGGCPCLELEHGRCIGLGQSAEWALDMHNCHLTPDLFPLIRAMVAGKWRCDTCASNEIDEDGTNACAIEWHGTPCANWQPKGGE